MTGEGEQQPAMRDAPSLVAREGWAVLHAFYRVDRARWTALDSAERADGVAAFGRLAAELAAEEGMQVLPLAMVAKADVGFVVLTPDLVSAVAARSRLADAFGPGVLAPVYEYFSMTERSEYMSTEAEHSEALRQERGLEPGTPEHGAAMDEFRARMEKYVRDRVYPRLPAWPLVCFYPMSKRRAPGQNWYALPFAERKRLMGGHARVGRKWHGKILQLITGSTGLDDHEWGVTLLARDASDLRGIVYEMRYDEVSAQYAEFGPFWVGLHVSAAELVARLRL